MEETEEYPPFRDIEVWELNPRKKRVAHGQSHSLKEERPAIMKCW